MQNEPIIYNRKNENAALPSYVTIDKRFRFSQGAITTIGLRVGMRLHLLEFGEKDWYFMIDEDSNGIKLGLEGTHIVAHATKICQLFKTRAKLLGVTTNSVSFPVIKTEKEYGAKRLWKIDLDSKFTTPRSEKRKKK